MLAYTIITKHQVFATDREPDDEEYAEKLVNEQDEKLNVLGFNYHEDYLLHFFDSPWGDEETISTDLYDAIQRLAIKDGADLVQFSNGNYGYVSYYNGELDGFEIIG